MNADLNHDRLRQILRQGDPAAQEPGLTLEETREMRRTVLTAIPEPRRRMAWLPILAAGAAALLVLALVIARGRQHPAPSAPPAVPQMAASPSPAPPPPEPEAQPPEPEKSAKPAHRPRAMRAPKVLPEPQGEPPVLVASIPVREIQFSTPGGTRVIWELPTNDAR